MAERKPAGLNRHQIRKHRHDPVPHMPIEDAAEAVPVTPEGATFIEDIRCRRATPDDLAASSAARAEAGVENIQAESGALDPDQAPPPPHAVR